MHASAQRPPQEKVCGYEYTVRRGDSFYLIANRLGIPLRDLLEANSDVNPARLMVGDVLCIPMEEDDAPPTEETPVPPAEPEEPLPEAPRPDEPLPDDDSSLDIPAGEEDDASCPDGTPHVIAQGEDAAALQLRANINRYTLQAANPTADLDSLQPGQTLCIPRENAPCPARNSYVLQREETIESAALKLNISIAGLLRANPCLAPSDFREGQCIYLP